MNTPNLEFRFRPVKMAIWMLFLAAIVAMMAWMSFASLDPDFYNAHETSRYRWVGELMNDLPIWLRSGFWAALAAICAWASWLFLRRWISGLPPLVASPEGVTGFVGAMGIRRLTIPWQEISKVQLVQSNLFLHGAPVDKGGIRKPKAPVIAVNLSMIGEKHPALMTKLEEYRSSTAQSPAA